MLKDIYENNLGKLEDFDAAHDTDYMDTLRTFSAVRLQSIGDSR